MEHAGKSPRRNLCAGRQLAEGKASGMDFESHSSWIPCPLLPDGEISSKYRHRVPGAAQKPAAQDNPIYLSPFSVSPCLRGAKVLPRKRSFIAMMIAISTSVTELAAMMGAACSARP